MDQITTAGSIIPWSAAGYRRCTKCAEEKQYSKFALKHSSKGRKYLSHTCNACRYISLKAKETPQQRDAKNAYCKEWIKARPAWARFKAYRSRDKAHGVPSILWKDAEPLLNSPCNWCGIFPSNGLDRLDNTLGHAVENVVPCCEKCNNILGDIPPQAKELLKEGLHEINKKEILREWIIPTSRKKK